MSDPASLAGLVASLAAILSSGTSHWRMWRSESPTNILAKAQEILAITRREWMAEVQLRIEDAIKTHRMTCSPTAPSQSGSFLAVSTKEDILRLDGRIDSLSRRIDEIQQDSQQSARLVAEVNGVLHGMGFGHGHGHGGGGKIERS